MLLKNVGGTSKININKIYTALLINLLLFYIKLLPSHTPKGKRAHISILMKLKWLQSFSEPRKTEKPENPQSSGNTPIFAYL